MPYLCGYVTRFRFLVFGQSWIIEYYSQICRKSVKFLASNFNFHVSPINDIRIIIINDFKASRRQGCRTNGFSLFLSLSIYLSIYLSISQIASLMRFLFDGILRLADATYLTSWISLGRRCETWEPRRDRRYVSTDCTHPANVISAS